MEKQLENPTQNQDKPTGKPNPKTVQPHWKTQPKPYSTENSLEMPNGAKSTASAAIGFAVVGSSIAIVSWGWEVKGCRLGVGGEGSVVEERGRGEGKREGKSEREAESAEG